MEKVHVLTLGQLRAINVQLPDETPVLIDTGIVDSETGKSCITDASINISENDGYIIIHVA